MAWILTNLNTGIKWRSDTYWNLFNCFLVLTLVLIVILLLFLLDRSNLLRLSLILNWSTTFTFFGNFTIWNRFISLLTLNFSRVLFFGLFFCLGSVLLSSLRVQLLLSPLDTDAQLVQIVHYATWRCVAFTSETAMVVVAMSAWVVAVKAISSQLFGWLLLNSEVAGLLLAWLIGLCLDERLFRTWSNGSVWKHGFLLGLVVAFEQPHIRFWS